MYDRLEKSKQHRGTPGCTFFTGKPRASFFDLPEFQNRSVKNEWPVQKADNKEKQTVDMIDLPKEQVISYVMGSFIKGEFSPSRIGSEGNLIQLKPTFVRFCFLISFKKSTSIGANLVYQHNKPQPSISYSSSSFYDAGHKLASQNGGLGEVNDWDFLQNKVFNQGNSRNIDDVEDAHPL